MRPTQRIARYSRARPEIIRRRLAELEHEWDVDAAFEANAALLSLAGLALGRSVSRRFYALAALAAGFLLQHALQGWAMPIEWLRDLGIRTPQEIEHERRALQAVQATRQRSRAGRHSET